MRRPTGESRPLDAWDDERVVRYVINHFFKKKLSNAEKEISGRRSRPIRSREVPNKTAKPELALIVPTGFDYARKKNQPTILEVNRQKLSAEL